ncbi:mucin-5AC [Erethizon dorsatum]
MSPAEAPDCQTTGLSLGGGNWLVVAPEEDLGLEDLPQGLGPPSFLQVHAHWGHSNGAWAWEVGGARVQPPPRTPSPGASSTLEETQDDLPSSRKILLGLVQLWGPVSHKSPAYPATSVSSRPPMSSAEVWLGPGRAWSLEPQALASGAPTKGRYHPVPPQRPPRGRPHVHAMGAGHRMLAVLWALVLACAQHSGWAQDSLKSSHEISPDLSPQQGHSGHPLLGVTVLPPLMTIPVLRALNPAHTGRVCSTWGDFHYKTFDGAVFRFPGLCNYVFSSHCGAAYEDFNVQLRRGPTSNATAPSKVVMKLNGLVVELTRDSVLVSGHPVQLPFSQAGVLIERSSGYMKVVAKLGLVFTWNLDDSLTLELDTKYANKTCGLCGDFNGVMEAGEFLSHNARLTPLEFGNLQKMDGPTEQCQDPNPAPQNCSTRPDLWGPGHLQGICEEMLNSRPFGGCTGLVEVNSYIEACQQDLCHCERTHLPDCLCHTLAEFSRQCAHAGGQPQDWRSPDLCPQTCSSGMQHQECGSPCTSTCSNPQRSQLCEDHCVAGCFCPEGMVLDDIHHTGCVPVSQCACVYSGTPYAPGANYSTDCTDTCVGGHWRCRELPCPGTCSVLGGAHFSTFDERQYTVHGDCSYVLTKPCQGSTFAVLAELRQCGRTDSETCLKSVTLSLGGGQMVVVVKAGGEVFMNQIYTQLPVSTANVTILKPSTFFIIAETNLGLQLHVQLVPTMQLFVRLAPELQGQTCGLCGNFNRNQADDFRTISGVVEGTGAAFANTWKTQASCPNAKNSFEDPCSLSVENEKYAQHWCMLLMDADGPFAECHATVSPSSYYSNCMFDTCNCERSEDCLCAALSSYAHACATKGVLLRGWRDGVCTKPTTTCPKSMAYQEHLSTCQPTCRSLSEADITCGVSFVPVDGCACPVGTFLDEAGTCVPAHECPCYHGGSVVPNGESMHDSGAICTCTRGVLTCIGGPVPSPVCNAPMVYFDCRNATLGAAGAGCQKSCHTLDMACYSTQCVSGCMCPDGLVADGDGGCVAEEDCPCVHNEASYRPGEAVLDGCNTCTCENRMWRCTDEPCLATCAIYGDGHFLTFDGQRYTFNGACEYTLVQDQCGGNGSAWDTFRVVTENVPCGTTGTTCSKDIKIFLGSYELKLSSGKMEVVQMGTGQEPPYTVRQMGIYLVVDTDTGLVLLWDRKTSLFLRLSPEFKGRVCGLCGNFDDNAINDLTTRSQAVVSDVLEFGNSWKFSPTCPDTLAPKDPCTANPYRKSWAQRQCSIINSATFAACHAHVEPAKYYEACVSDACACDSGGDCECFCTAVAAYAQACHAAGVCVSWRTPDICPLFCDYYNPEGECEWHYQPCGAPCLRTCRNPSGRCLQDLRGLEGCYPKCPPGAPIFDEDKMQCVAKCLLPTSAPHCHIHGKSYRLGATVPPGENCHSCVCTESGVYCTYNSEACFCTYGGQRFRPGTEIYHTTDGMGGCLSASCGVNGTVERKAYACGSHSTATPTTFTFSTVSEGVSGPPGITKASLNEEQETLALEAQMVALPGASQTKSSMQPPGTHPPPTWSTAHSSPQSSTKSPATHTSHRETPAEASMTSWPCGEECVWSLWLDISRPGRGIDSGDYDTLENLRAHGHQLCQAPKEVQCRAEDAPDVPLSILGQHVECSPTVGLTCHNRDQVSGLCDNYQVRVLCCHPVPCPTLSGPTVSSLAPVTTTGPATDPTATGSPSPHRDTASTAGPKPVPTTSSCLQEQCTWTGWIDGSYPGPGRDSGDFDTLADLRSRGYKFCDRPRSVQCRAQFFPNTPLAELGQQVTCSPEVGLLCLNREQLPPICYNYEIRIQCCEWVHSCRVTPRTPATSATPQPTVYKVSTSTSTPRRQNSSISIATSTATSTPRPHTRSTSTPTTTSTPRPHTSTASVPMTTSTPTPHTSTTSISGPSPRHASSASTSPPGTTDCRPQCSWTLWFDVDSPEPGSHGGDLETYDHILQRGHRICRQPEEVTRLQCRAQRYPEVPIATLGQVVQCDRDVGLVCHNRDQRGPEGLCLDYEVRVLCCRVPEGCPTLEPVTTTTEEGTTSSSRESPASTRGSSETSVHTASSASTQRPSSISVPTATSTPTPRPHTSTTSGPKSTSTNTPHTSTSSIPVTTSTSTPYTSSTSVPLTTSTSTPTPHTSTTSVPTVTSTSTPTAHTSTTSIPTNTFTSTTTPHTSTTSVYTTTSTSTHRAHTSSTSVPSATSTPRPHTSPTSVPTATSTSTATPHTSTSSIPMTTSTPTPHTSFTSVPTATSTSTPTPHTSTTSVPTNTFTSTPTPPTSSTSVGTATSIPIPRPHTSTTSVPTSTSTSTTTPHTSTSSIPGTTSTPRPHTSPTSVPTATSTSTATPHTSTSSIPMTTSTPRPHTSSTSVPTATSASTATPHTSTTSLPMTTSTPTPHSSSTSVPLTSFTSTPRPHTRSTSVPMTTSTSISTPTSTPRAHTSTSSIPGTTSTSTPHTSSTSVPLTTSTSTTTHTPHTSTTSVPMTTSTPTPHTRTTSVSGPSPRHASSAFTSPPGITDCQPQCSWTLWFDVDSPEPGSHGGDLETYDHILQRGHRICHQPEEVTRLQCRAQRYPEVPIATLGQVVQCDRDVGLVCHNRDQRGPEGLCLDYEVRVLCCRVPEGCPTLEPVTTTTEEGTTSSSREPPASTRGSSETSVHTASSASTQRPSSISVPTATSTPTPRPHTRTTSVPKTPPPSLGPPPPPDPIPAPPLSTSIPMTTSTSTSTPTSTPRAHTSTSSIPATTSTSTPHTSSTSVPLTTSTSTATPHTSTSSIPMTTSTPTPHTSFTSVPTATSTPTPRPHTSTTSIPTSTSTSTATPHTSTSSIPGTISTPRPHTSSTSVTLTSSTSTRTPHTRSTSVPMTTSTPTPHTSTTSVSGPSPSHASSASTSPPGTTDCRPQCSWTLWFDVDSPEPGSHGGDLETYDHILQRGHRICRQPEEVTRLQCRAQRYPEVPIATLGQVVQCDRDVGLVCHNRDQRGPEGLCLDYEVRVLCCRVPEGCPTLEPVTTTTEEGTTSSSRESPASTRGSSETSVHTASSASTQRPSSISVPTATSTPTPRPHTSTTSGPKSTSTNTPHTSTSSIPVTTSTSTPYTSSTSVPLTTSTSTPTPHTSTTSVPTVTSTSTPTAHTSTTSVPTNTFTSTTTPHTSTTSVYTTTSTSTHRTHTSSTSVPSATSTPRPHTSPTSVPTATSTSTATPHTSTSSIPMTTSTPTPHTSFTSVPTATSTPTPRTHTSTTSIPTSTSTSTTTPHTSTSSIPGTISTPRPHTSSTSVTLTSSTSTRTPHTSTTSVPMTTSTPTPHTSTTSVSGPSLRQASSASTLPPGTTDCQPQCSWTLWFDVDSPEPGSHGGDLETYDHIHQRGHRICRQPEEVTRLQCRAQRYPEMPIATLGQVVQCDRDVGLVCHNRDQQGPEGLCLDYEVRVLCCRVPKGCPTLEPVTTTTEEGTTSPSWEPPASTRGSSETSVHTASSASTQRPSSISVPTATSTPTPRPHTSTTSIPKSTSTSTPHTSTSSIPATTSTSTPHTSSTSVPLTTSTSTPTPHTSTTSVPTVTSTSTPTAHTSTTSVPTNTFTSTPTPPTSSTSVHTATSTPTPKPHTSTTSVPTSTSTSTTTPHTSTSSIPGTTSTPRPHTSSTSVPTATSASTATLHTSTTSLPMTTSTPTPHTSSTSVPLTSFTSTPRPHTRSTSVPMTTSTSISTPTSTPRAHTSTSSIPGTTSTSTPYTSSTSVPLTTSTSTSTHTPHTSTTSVPMTTSTPTPHTSTTSVSGPSPRHASSASTLPHGTMDCQPQCSWTLWFDVDSPEPGSHGGDLETYDHILQRGHRICRQPEEVTRLQCRAQRYPEMPIATLDQVVQCDRDMGLVCHNRDQRGPEGLCLDYEVRVLCCRVPEGCPSTPGTSTTETSSSALSSTMSSSSAVPSSPYCFCHVSGQLYPAGSVIYHQTDLDGHCYHALCSWDCHVVRGVDPTCPTPTPTPPASTHISRSLCLNVVPQRKKGETWAMPNCLQATCEGDNVISLSRRPCPELTPPFCANGYPAMKVADADSCCQHYQCQCVCSGWGDPHYITFDGTYYTFLDDCTYVLVQQIVPVFGHFRVLVDNDFCDVEDRVSCPQSIIVEYHEDRVVLTRRPVGGAMTNQILFNDKVVSPGFQKNGIAVSHVGIKMYVTIRELGVQVMFSGLIFSVEVPFSTFANNTEGQCGTCTNDKKDECRMPGGALATSCSEMSGHWRVDTPDQPFCRGPLPTPTSVVHDPSAPTSAVPTPPPTLCPPSPICELILTNVFELCHAVIEPLPFFEGCVFDYCHKTDLEVTCSSLELYASLCAAQGVCVDWRSQTNNSCPFPCPADKVYQPCGLSDPPYCYRSDNASSLAFPEASRITEGCFCPGSLKLFSASALVCVPKDCPSCLGPHGEPILPTPKAHMSSLQPGQIISMDCQECVCDPVTKSMTCHQKACPPPPACHTPGFVSVSMIPRVGQCCPQYSCVCNSSYCPKPQDCPKGSRLILTHAEGACCPTQNCSWTACSVNGTLYQPGAVVSSSLCESCRCEVPSGPNSDGFMVSCETQICNTHCPMGFEYQPQDGQCCGKCVQKTCVVAMNVTGHPARLLLPGESLSDPGNPCVHHTCERYADRLEVVMVKRECPSLSCARARAQLSQDGCCLLCPPTPTMHPQEWPCALRHRQQVLQHQNCSSATPVRLAYCEGICGDSTSKYSPEANAVEHRCHCCQELRTSRKTVTLRCADGSRLAFSYTQVEECGCQGLQCQAPASWDVESGESQEQGPRPPQ